MRILKVMSPRRTPSRRRLVNIMEESLRVRKPRGHRGRRPTIGMKLTVCALQASKEDIWELFRVNDWNASGSSDGIWIIDANGNTILANARMAEILRTSASAMVGESSFIYVFPDDQDAAQRLFNSKSTGDSKPFHFRLRRKDGSEVWVDVQGTPLRSASGKFTGIVGTFTVATDPKAL